MYMRGRDAGIRLAHALHLEMHPGAQVCDTMQTVGEVGLRRDEHGDRRSVLLRERKARVGAVQACDDPAHILVLGIVVIIIIGVVLLTFHLGRGNPATGLLRTLHLDPQTVREVRSAVTSALEGGLRAHCNLQRRAILLLEHESGGRRVNAQHAPFNVVILCLIVALDPLL